MVHTILTFGAVLGIALLVIGMLVASMVLVASGTPETVLDQALLYIRIYFVGIPFMVAYNFGAAIVRSYGDTRRPMCYLIVSGVLNVILNLLLVIGFHLGVAGVAIATVISQAIAFLWALIYLITYLVMLYVASRKPIYMVLGLGSGALASVVAYHLFAHVRDRVIAWKDPLSVIDDQGYQISQSLFAIGSGGWFGVGLGQGMPDKIPVVKTDFVFSAIAEEFGVVFAICIIFICISCFLMFFNISMQVKDIFYKLIALGIGTLYGTQVFLALGGVTKFIPSTGVTLPLVSYGGSSLLSTIILFAIIQGLYVMQVDEGESDERMERARKKRR